MSDHDQRTATGAETSSILGPNEKNLDLVLLTTQGESTELKAVKEDVFVPPPPPDGGYGWLVVVSSFLINVLCDGTCFSFAIFFNDIGEYYGEKESTVAWVGSSLLGCYLLVGPFAGSLTNRFGCRVVCISGAVVTCVAFFFSQFSPNVYVLIVLYGVVGGLGMGLCYLTSVVVVGLYFEKRRATATGISVCGSGVGCFVVAPVMSILNDHYGWRGSFMISGAIMLNLAVCGALFRPLASFAGEKKKTNVFELERPPSKIVPDVNSNSDLVPHAPTRQDSECSDLSSFFGSRNSFHQSALLAHSKMLVMETLPEVDDVNRSAASRASALAKKRQRAVSESVDIKRPASLSRVASLSGAPQRQAGATDAAMAVDGRVGQETRSPEREKAGKREDDVFGKSVQINYGPAPKRLVEANRQTATVAANLTNYFLVENEGQKSSYWRKKERHLPGGSQFSLHAIPTNVSLKWIESVGNLPHPEVVMKYRAPPIQRTASVLTKVSSKGRFGQDQNLPPLSKKDIFYNRSILDIDHYQSIRSGLARIETSETIEDEDRVEEIKAIRPKKADKCYSCFVKVLTMLDCGLMKSPTFFLINVSSTLIVMSLTIPYMYLMKYGESVGVQRSSSKWFISIIGICSSCFRIVAGLIADAPWADVVHITTVSLTIGAVATFLLPFYATTFALISVYCSIFAFSVACYVSLRPIVIVELFGLENLTSAFGLTLLFQGIASLLAPPLAGKLFEASGSYTLTFVATGVGFMTAAALHGPVKQVAICEGRRKERRETKTEQVL